jgi:hypothetical protein
VRKPDSRPKNVTHAPNVLKHNWEAVGRLEGKGGAVPHKRDREKEGYRILNEIETIK